MLPNSMHRAQIGRQAAGIFCSAVFSVSTAMASGSEVGADTTAAKTDAENALVLSDEQIEREAQKIKDSIQSTSVVVPRDLSAISIRTPEALSARIDELKAKMKEPGRTVTEVETMAAEVNELITEMGLAITKEQKARDRGWQDTQALMIMTLRDSKGRERRRELRLKTLEVLGGGDKSLAVFDAPKDIKGTAVLTVSNNDGSDDQWLYLPGVKRIKRIALRKKSGPFMGSELSYEDLTSFEIEKYRFTYLHDEVLDGKECFVVEMVPLDEFSGYSRLVAYVEKEAYRAWKIDYYAANDSLLKTMTIADYSQFEERYWRPIAMHMQNHQSGKSTSVEWQDYRFKTGLDDSDFTKQSLKRIK